MNKSSLVREVVSRTGAEPSEVSAVVDAVLEAIRATVARGDRVVLSRFGTFERIRRNPRTGRNPHTGEPVEIPARTVPVFRPGTAFREAVAGRRRTRGATRKPGRAGARRR